MLVAILSLGLGHCLPMVANGFELMKISAGQLAQIRTGHLVAQQFYSVLCGVFHDFILTQSLRFAVAHLPKR